MAEMATTSELREMSDEQLVAEINETQKQLFKTRFQGSTEKLEAPSDLRKLRRKIARVKTIQQERHHKLIAVQLEIKPN